MNQTYEIDYLKPATECNPDEMNAADNDQGCWLYGGTVEAASEAEALAIASEENNGWETRIHEA